MSSNKVKPLALPAALPGSVDTAGVKSEAALAQPSLPSSPADPGKLDPLLRSNQGSATPQPLLKAPLLYGDSLSALTDPTASKAFDRPPLPAETLAAGTSAAAQDAEEEERVSEVGGMHWHSPLDACLGPYSPCCRHAEPG